MRGIAAFVVRKGKDMLEYIKGTIERIGVNDFAIETGGVGFHIEAGTRVTERLKLHETKKIYTHMNVREDDISLFGFLTQDDVDVFRMLIGVSGIGPKVALSILSELSVEDLRMAVLSEDTKAIAKANGVGAKTAQRVIMELKDKFKLDEAFASYDDQSAGVEAAGAGDVISETALALTSLGYTNTEALKAIKKVEGADMMTPEQLLKAALKKIM